MKLHRQESREVYPVPERPHYTIKLTKGTVDFFISGQEMKDEQIGDVIVRLVNALNAAEKQLDALFTMIQNLDYEITPGEAHAYLEDYAEDEDFAAKYKIEDLKDSLFHAMMKKDEKSVGRLINQINVVQEKQKVR